MKMEFAFEVIRGYPQDGSLDRVEPIKAAVTLKNGDVVAKQTDGTVDLCGATATNDVGVVVQGNGDSSSAAASGKAVILWGNYIARVASTAYTAGAYVPGSKITAKSGKIALVTTTDPVVGSVLEIVAEDNSLIILVK